MISSFAAFAAMRTGLVSDEFVLGFEPFDEIPDDFLRKPAFVDVRDPLCPHTQTELPKTKSDARSGGDLGQQQTHGDQQLIASSGERKAHFIERGCQKIPIREDIFQNGVPSCGRDSEDSLGADEQLLYDL